MSANAPPPDNQSPELFGQTPWQPVGPFFHLGLFWKGGDRVGSSDTGAQAQLLAPQHGPQRGPADAAQVPGERIEIAGRVLDGQGAAVPDAMLEIWQADAAGRYVCAAEQGGMAHGPGPLPAFMGFGRAATAEDGGFRILTIMPGRVPGPRGVLQAAHLAIGVFSPGLLKRLVTRIYFEDQPGIDTDPVLARVPAARRATLIARRVAAAAPAPAERCGRYGFDLCLQGPRETVFFEY
jgi:protocatechuate 3,4-dioxygenase, alpha subunit